MRHRSRGLAVVLACLAAATLVASACSTTTGASTESGPAPIKIGALVPVTGLGLSNYIAAFKAAVRDLNGHGGIKGRPIVLENCDDQNDPNQAQACARQLASDNVIATVADVSGYSMVEGPILDSMGIPQVGNTPLNPEDANLPTAFPLSGGLLGQIAGGLVGMKRRGLQSLFIAWSDTPSGRTTVPVATPLLKAAGITLSDSVSVPPAATDIGMYVLAAMQSHAQVVFPSLSPAQTIQFITASKQAGASYVIMVPYGQFSQRDIDQMGNKTALTENDIEFSTVPPLSAADQFPAVKQYIADMDAELAAGDAGAAPDQRSGNSLMAWLSVQIVAKLASTLALINPSSIWGALLTYQTIDTLGMTPPWSPRKSGPSSANPKLTNMFGYLVTQRGGIEVLSEPAPLNPLQVLGP
jgi:ABC-type branched-subunit amino acid transport system substrate-binding protein